MLVVLGSLGFHSGKIILDIDPILNLLLIALLIKLNQGDFITNRKEYNEKLIDMRRQISFDLRTAVANKYHGFFFINQTRNLSTGERYEVNARKFAFRRVFLWADYLLLCIRCLK